MHPQVETCPIRVGFLDPNARHRHSAVTQAKAPQDNLVSSPKSTEKPTGIPRQVTSASHPHSWPRDPKTPRPHPTAFQPDPQPIATSGLSPSHPSELWRGGRGSCMCRAVYGQQSRGESMGPECRRPPRQGSHLLPLSHQLGHPGCPAAVAAGRWSGAAPQSPGSWQSWPGGVPAGGGSQGRAPW